MKKGIIIKCIICNNKFYIKTSRINIAKYCSIKCRSVGFLGKNNPIPQRRNPSKRQLYLSKML